MKRKRSKARGLALQLLFAIEVSSFSPEETIEIFWQERSNVEPEIRDFANLLVMETLKGASDFDKMIALQLEHWELERVALIDKLILRMAIYEFTSGQTPTTVIINEAIELAKRYSTTDSYRFINGILDKIREKEFGKKIC